MKKSELYHIAMRCVVNSLSIDDDTKLEILDVLRTDKSLAEWNEKKAAEKEGNKGPQQEPSASGSCWERTSTGLSETCSALQVEG